MSPNVWLSRKLQQLRAPRNSSRSNLNDVLPESHNRGQGDRTKEQRSSTSQDLSSIQTKQVAKITNHETSQPGNPHQQRSLSEYEVVMGSGGLHIRRNRPIRRLCDRCQSIPTSFFTELDSWFDHYGSNGDLELSAWNGCHLCTLICRSLREGTEANSGFFDGSDKDDDDNRWLQLKHAEKVFPGGSSWHFIDPTIYRRGRLSGAWMASKIGAWLRFQFVPEPGLEDTVDDDPASPTCFAMIKSWLQKCDADHARCNEHRSSSTFVPTRLIRVGTAHEPELPRLENTSLLLPSLLIQPLRYLALSHCWGSGSETELTKTTKSNIYSQEAGIIENSLPKTFRDLIFIARTLEISYVWIDSLCIIQDSPEDWDLEAARMGQVYINAYCTVAATASKDGSGGCFVARNPLDVQICDITNLGPLAEHYASRLDGWDNTWEPIVNIRPPLTKWSSMVEEGVLSSRAWTLQERLLSPRIIHYTAREIVLECRTTQFSESIPEDYDNLKPSWNSLQAPRIFDIPWDSLLPSITFKRWYELIADYSHRHLTVQSDIFPALSGLVKEIQRHKSWTYVAGLWKEDLQNGLYWEPLEQTAFRDQSYRAPSWSWASIVGPMSHHGNGDNEGAPVILEVHTTALGTDRHGRIKDAYLQVQGLVRSVSDYKEYMADYSHVHITERPVSLKFDTKEDTEHNSIHLLRFRIHRDVKKLKAIILASVPGENGQSTFRRIGMAHLNDFDFFNESKLREITLI